MVFSHQELSTLAAALHTAAERYRDCAKVLAETDMAADAKARLVAQFERQIADCAALLERIE